MNLPLHAAAQIDEDRLGNRNRLQADKDPPVGAARPRDAKMRDAGLQIRVCLHVLCYLAQFAVADTLLQCLQLGDSASCHGAAQSRSYARCAVCVALEASVDPYKRSIVSEQSTHRPQPCSDSA